MTIFHLSVTTGIPMNSSQLFFVVLSVAIGVLLFTDGDNEKERKYNFITYTKPAPMRQVVPTNIHLRNVSTCSFVVVRGFLKEECFVDNVKYFKCINSERYYSVKKATCTETILSKVCPNDPTFYQACGHKNCLSVEDGLKKQKFQTPLFGPDVAACGELICKKNPHDDERNDKKLLESLRGTALNSGLLLSSSNFKDLEYKEDLRCRNTVNGLPVNEYAKQVLNSDQLNKDISKCDNECDESFCSDEATCNNMTVGIFCFEEYWNETKYVSPFQICDGFNDCSSQIDERGCSDFQESCKSSNFRLLYKAGLPYSSEVSRALSPRSKCSVPLAQENFRVCNDYRDQMNCTGSTISPLLCNVDRYPTTISEHVICQGLNLCDDNIDNHCRNLELGCKVHKHRLCDGTDDCLNGYDESDTFCKDLIPGLTFNCTRAFSRGGMSVEIPSNWILDGVSDCRNSLDEDPAHWTKQCGFGLKKFYNVSQENAPDCSTFTQFICPTGVGLINLDRVCSGNALDNCDAQVCVTARKEYLKGIKSKVENKRGAVKSALFCLPGLCELERFTGKCSDVRLLHQKHVLGVPDIQVLMSKTFAETYIECSEIFGELYLFLSCSGICGSEDTQSCPLKPDSATYSCLNYPTSMNVRSLADDGKLVLTISDGFSYSKAFFPCDNGRCTTLDQVCNLADDCGDFSDELGCSNNFKCNISGEYIPLTLMCDGKFDCYDYSDECNIECTNHVKMFDHLAIRVSAWIFGVSATVLNAFTLIHGFYEFKKLKTETAIINKSFVSLITFG